MKVFRSLTSKYILIGLIVLLIIAAFTYTSFWFTTRLRNDARRINYAGRERMLNFEMAYLLNRAMREAGEERVDNLNIIREEKIPLFEEVIYGIRDGSEGLGLEPLLYEDVVPEINSLIDGWKKNVKPLLMMAMDEVVKGKTASLEEYNALVHGYVDNIDTFVGHLVIDYEEKLKEYEWLRFSILALAAFSFTALILFIRHALVRPVRRLSYATREIEKGNFDVSIRTRTSDEIGDLTNSFNSMAQSLKALLDEKEERLKEIEVLASFPEENPYPVIECDMNCAITYLNPAARSFMEEHRLKGIDLLPADLSKIVKELMPGGGKLAYQEVEIGGAIFGEYIHLLPDKIRVYTYDITRRKEAEQLLRDRETRLSTMVETATDAIVTIGQGECITGFNKGAEQMFGYSLEEVLGKQVEMLMPERYRARHKEALQRFLATKQSKITGKTREYEILCKDGSELPVSITMSPAEIEGGFIFLAIIRDIPERKQAEEKGREDIERMKIAYKQTTIYARELNTKITEIKKAEESLRESEERLSTILGNSVDAIIFLDNKELIQYVNPAAEALFGRNTEELIGKEFGFPIMSSKTIEVEISQEGGDLRFAELRSAEATWKGEKAYVVSLNDITKRKLAESELKKFSDTIEQSMNMVFITDKEGRIEYTNPTLEKVTGYSKEEVIGQTPRLFASGETTMEEYEELWQTILAGKTWHGTFKNRKKNGQYYWVNSLISPIRSEKGEITHFLSVQDDVTEMMRSEERVEYLGSHDELTGLLSRSFFMKVLDEWAAYDEDKKNTGVLLLIDIDDFKSLNDTYGHLIGDRLLSSVSELLKKKVGDIDSRHKEKSIKESIVARLGSDEFAVFLLHRGKKEGVEEAEEIRIGIEGLRLKEIPVQISASIGMSIYPAHGGTARDLLTKADAATYRAKEMGHNRCHLYRPEDHDLEEMQKRLTWKGRIQKALAEDRFIPWFQPILDLREDKVTHYEALVRLIDEEGAILLPGAFLDVAERFGVIGEIDRVVIEKTMRVQVEMSRIKKGITFTFSINLSGRDLGDEKVLSFIKTKITETGADPNYLIFEITETSAVHDLKAAIKFIDALKEIGCHFALDDFGVGFTSFVYLKEMKVDYIKIDGSFIRRLHENPNDQLFVRAITDVSKGMGIKTVAEFVETEETLKLLREYDVDYAQGYLIGKPAPEVKHE
jgi:diguanylate cyclase (GGDEF)-like protein/PAS domain S-box-containing protein